MGFCEPLNIPNSDFTDGDHADEREMFEQVEPLVTALIEKCRELDIPVVIQMAGENLSFAVADVESDNASLTQLFTARFLHHTSSRHGAPVPTDVLGEMMNSAVIEIMRRELKLEAAVEAAKAQIEECGAN